MAFLSVLVAPVQLSSFNRIAKHHPLPPANFPFASRSSFLVPAKQDHLRWNVSLKLLRTCRVNYKNFLPRAEKREGADRPVEVADVSVFRFTLGIPGFDDAELPTLVGTVFGGLLILNHIFSLDTVTAAQTRSEGVGLVLAAVSISLSNIGRQLNDTKKSQKEIEPGQRQVLSFADALNQGQKNDFAWVSYNILRNTSTTAMLVVYSGQVVGARGFWSFTTDLDPVSVNSLRWLQEKLGDKTIQDFSILQEPLYLPINIASERWDFIPTDTASMVVQPFSSNGFGGTTSSARGFLLVVSRTAYGYKRKDRIWIAFLAKKLAGVLAK